MTLDLFVLTYQQATPLLQSLPRKSLINDVRLLPHRPQVEIPHLLLPFSIHIRLILQLRLQTLYLYFLFHVHSHMRVLEVLRVCQCGDQFLVQLEQIVRVEEELGVTLLHVCEQLGEPSSIVLAHGLSDIRHVLIDLLS